MRHHRGGTWIGVAFATILFGQLVLQTQGHVQVTSQPGNQSGTIQGSVLRAGTGQALKRARVSLRRVNGDQTLPNVLPGSPAGALIQQIAGAVANIQAVTDDTGRYVFNGVAPGQYRITIDREGYIHQEFGQHSFTGPGQIITLAAGQQIGNLDIQMVPAGSISGRIFDEDGEAMTGVQVQAETYTYQQGKRVRIPSGHSGQTNDLGEYRIYWLSPGEYYIDAKVQRGEGRVGVNPVVNLEQRTLKLRNGDQATATIGVPQQRSEETYAPTYFPGTVIPESATPVPVPPSGDVRGIDFTLRPTETVSIRGQLILPVSSEPTPSSPASSGPGTGKPMSNPRGPQMSIQLGRAGIVNAVNFGPMPYTYQVTVDADGHFEVSKVIPGSYNLSGWAEQNGRQYSAEMKLDVPDNDIDNLRIPLRTGISVAGRIFVDSNLPSGLKLSQLRVMLPPAEDGGFAGSPGARLGLNVQVADDGTFTLSDVPPMTYRVRVAGLLAGGYVVAGRIGNEDAVNQPFVITGDQDVSLQLQIGFRVGRVSGTVVDDKGMPYPGVLATLIPDEPSRQRPEFYFSTPTDQYGHFTFANVPPGGYKLFAWDDISGDAYQDPEFIRKYEVHGVPIKVDGGASVDQQVGITRE